jgi:hypothetical protein
VLSSTASRKFINIIYKGWSLIVVDGVYSQALPGTWTMKSPLPEIRAEVAAVALNGRVHAFGGSLDGMAQRHCQEHEIILPSLWPTEKFMLLAALLLTSL